MVIIYVLNCEKTNTYSIEEEKVKKKTKKPLKNLSNVPRILKVEKVGCDVPSEGRVPSCYFTKESTGLDYCKSTTFLSLFPGSHSQHITLPKEIINTGIFLVEINVYSFQ